MSASIDNLINVNFTKGRNDLLKFGLMLGGKGDYRPPQFDAESLKFEYIDANESYGIDLNGSRFLQKLTFAESQDFTRATTGTFIGSNGLIQTAAIDAPRFTHDPVTREVQGLLIEEQRTNLFTYSIPITGWITRSDDDDGTSWTNDFAVAPDGTTTAIRFNPNYLADPGGATREFIKYEAINTVAGDTNTFSLYVKPIVTATTGAGDLLLTIEGESGGGSVVVNLKTMTVQLTTGEAEAAIEYTGNGWYRISNTYTATRNDTNDNHFIAFSNRTSRNNFDPYPNGNEDAYIWGAQVEQGSFPTSYIPTAGSQVTRAADNCSRALGAEFNPNEFSFYLEAPIPRLFDDRNAQLIEFSDGSNNNRYLLQRVVNSTDLVFVGVTSANGVSFTMTLGIAALSNQTAKISASVSSTSATLVVDGVSVSDTVSDALTVVTQFNLGTKWDGSNKIGEAVFKDVQLYPEALTESELITLTGGT